MRVRLLHCLAITALALAPQCFAAARNGPPPAVNGTLPLTGDRWQSARLASSAASPLPARHGGAEALRSLLIPGWGQLSKGDQTRGFIFLGAEALLIGGLVSQKIYQGRLQDDYQTFATQHAGVNGARDHQFYVDIGNWMDQQGYNEQRLRYRQFDQMYTDPDHNWQWDADANRLHFKDMRLRADAADQRALLFTGGLILNHLLSFIDASRGSKSLAIGAESSGGQVRLRGAWSL